MPSKPGSIYWDSCVFLDGFRHTEGRMVAITAIEAHAKLGGVHIYASALTLAEVNRVSAEYDAVTLDEVRGLDRYFENPWVKIVPIDRLAGRIAAEIVRQGLIKPADATHLAVAAKLGVSEFHTYDGSGGKKDGLLAKRGEIRDVEIAGRVYVIPKIIAPEDSVFSK